MAGNIDQQFVEYIVKALVGNPDAVSIERTIDERGVLLQLKVDPQDLGRVIGRNGATAKSIRTLLRALGVKNDARYNLKIVDTNEGGAPVVSDDEAQAPAAEPAADQPVETPVADQPVQETAAEPEPPEEAEPEVEEPQEEDSVSRHRQDIEDLTDLDI